MNEENLKPFNRETAVKYAKKGAEASVRVRKEKKKLREMVKMFGEMKAPDQVQKYMEKQGLKGKDMTNYMSTVVGLFAKARGGDTAAFNAIRDIIGEKPKDVVDNNFTGDLKIGYVSTGTKFPSSEDEVDV